MADSRGEARCQEAGQHARDDQRRAGDDRSAAAVRATHSPLRAAPDAVALDTTGLTIDQVIDRAVELARAAAARATSS